MTKYSDWIVYFRNNTWLDEALPWASSSPLSAGERSRVMRSMQQFQLGEWSEGRTLLDLARRHAAGGKFPDLVDSMRLFIAEEQRHSAMLGKFLDRENISRIERDVIDRIFRRLRRLAGFETMITVLVSAECIALPYYAALHDATKCPLLRALCRRIQRDEDMHYCYQGYTLGFFSRTRGFWSESLVRSLHRLLVLGLGTVVFTHHRALFRAAGFSLARFLGMAFQALAQVEQRLGSNVIVGIGWSNPPRWGRHAPGPAGG